MKLKRVLCLVVVICIAGMLFAGCAPNGPTATEATPSPSPVESTGYDGVTGEKFKIGFTYLPTTDTLSAAFRKVLDYTAAQFGCEMVYADMNTGDLSDISMIESAVQAGLDAYICVNLTGTMIDLFDKNGVYFVQACNKTVDPDLLARAMKSEYFCGMIAQDEVQAGYQMCEKLYNAGSRYFAYTAPPAGMVASHDDRVRGIEKFVKEHPDMVLATSIRGMDFSGAPIEELIAAYPTLDGLLATGASPVVPAVIYTAGLQAQIKYATIDIQEGTADLLADGFMIGVAGGQQPAMQLAFAVLYEALTTGDKLIADLETPLYSPYIWITSADEYNDYMASVEGEIPPYTGDELKDLCGFFNTEVSLADRQAQLAKFCADYSLDDVLARRRRAD